jgi:hypothetical protein
MAPNYELRINSVDGKWVLGVKMGLFFKKGENPKKSLQNQMFVR